MKKFVGLITLFALATSLLACNKVEPSSNSKQDSNTSAVSPSISSNKESSSAAPQIKENELSTTSGLVVKFKEEGASIEKITWQNKEIAKDGFVVGRCANRIKDATFKIDGVTYTADANLHGGKGTGWNSWRGPFATANWTRLSQTANTISFKIHSNDGDHGYPGNMDMTVKYTLSEEGELLIEYTATTDKATLCNPTNHLYIDINGNDSYDNVSLMINADQYTPLDSNQIPTGNPAPVEGTQFDYRAKKTFDKSKAYDDNYVLNGEGFRHVATLTGESSRLAVMVHTDRPGLQLYKENNGNICLETQMMPDAINQPNFEDPILRPGETFYSKTSYSFVPID